MKRLSAMGSSKYEFEGSLDDDIRRNQTRYDNKKANIRRMVRKAFESEPDRLEETFHMMIEVLKEMKQDFKL